MRIITEFNEVSRHDIELVGKNGAMLAEISNSKIPTPHAFIVTAEAYEFFLDSNDIKKEVNDLLDAGNYSKVAELIENSLIPDQIVSKVSKAYNNLSLNREIIIAGKKDITVELQPSLNKDIELSIGIQSACGPNEVLYTLQNCWSSLYSEENIKKIADKGISPKDIKLAVVIQSILRGEKSGIAKTHANEIEIEATWGVMPPTDIISTSDHYLIDRETLNAKEGNIGNQKRMYKLVQNKVSEVNVPLGMNDQQKLAENELKQVARQALKTEKLLESPLDLEWIKYANEIVIKKVRRLVESKNEATPDAQKQEEPSSNEQKPESSEPVTTAPAAEGNVPVPAVERTGPATTEQVKEGTGQVTTERTEPATTEQAKEGTGQVTTEGTKATTEPTGEGIEPVTVVPTVEGNECKTPEVPEVEEKPEGNKKVLEVTGIKLLSQLKDSDLQGDISIDTDGIGILDLSQVYDQQEHYNKLKNLLEMFYPKEVRVLLSKNRERQNTELENIKRLRETGYTNALPIFPGIVDISQLPESSMPFGIHADTPACLVLIGELSKKAAFVNIDVNAITGLLVGGNTAFDEGSGAVTECISSAVSACKKNRIPVGAVLQSQLILPMLINSGISSLTTSQENLELFRTEILREEKRLILEKT